MTKNYIYAYKYVHRDTGVHSGASKTRLVVSRYYRLNILKADINAFVSDYLVCLV